MRSGRATALSGPTQRQALIGLPSPAQDILASELFPVPAMAEAKYVGAGYRSTRYLGARSDTQLYVGAGLLFPA